MPDEPDNRDASGKYTSGTSGNPGGRSNERERLRKYVLTFGEEAIDQIRELSRAARSDKVKLDASVWLAEQAIGKSLVAISGPEGGPLEVDSAALGEALKRLSGGG